MIKDVSKLRIILLFGNHFEQIFACELVTCVSSCQNVLGEVTFRLVQTDDFLFDGVLAGWQDSTKDPDGTRSSLP